MEKNNLIFNPMKYLVPILFLLCSITASAQPKIVRSSGSNTVYDTRLGGLLNFVPPAYTDTTAANLQKGIDSAGAIFYAYNDKGFWLRQHSPKKWVKYPTTAEMTAAIAAATPDSLYFNPTAFLTQGRNKRIDDSIKLVTNTALALLLARADSNYIIGSHYATQWRLLNALDSAIIANALVAGSGMTITSGVVKLGGNITESAVLDLGTMSPSFFDGFVVRGNNNGDGYSNFRVIQDRISGGVKYGNYRDYEIFSGTSYYNGAMQGAGFFSHGTYQQLYGAGMYAKEDSVYLLQEEINEFYPELNGNVQKINPYNRTLNDTTLVTLVGMHKTTGAIVKTAWPSSTVTSIATNNGTGITGGTITGTGTLSNDTTTILSTKANAQKFVDIETARATAAESGKITNIPFAVPASILTNSNGDIVGGAEGDYVNEGDTLWRWHNTIPLRATTVLNYSVNSGASWSADIATDLPVWFPHIRKHNGVYYAIGTNSAETEVYLYSSVNKTSWVIQNSGSAIFSRTNTITDWRYNLFNPAFTIVSTGGIDTIHYLIEGSASQAGSGGYYGTNMFLGYAKAPLASPASTLPANPQMIGGNAQLFFIKEHNALFTIFGQYSGVFPNYSADWRLRFAKASLSNRLTDSASWAIQNFYIQTGNWADPSIEFLPNIDSAIIYYNVDQSAGRQAYLPRMRSALQLYEAIKDTSSMQWATNGSDIYYGNGNVGIGTTAPGTGTAGRGGTGFGTKAFDISSTGRSILGVKSNNTTNIATVVLSANNTTLRDLHINHDYLGNTDFYQYRNGTAGTVLYLKNDGSIGMGTASPGYKLDVSGGDINTSAKYRVAGTQAIYIPGGNFTGTYIYGNGGGSLSYTIGTEGKYNTYTGFYAGYSSTTGHFNTASGAYALSSCTSCLNNVAVGYLSLNLITTGNGNVAVGWNALGQLTGGGANVAVGKDALALNTGYFNTAIGSQSMIFNTSGAYNVSLGASSMYSNTTGVGGVALGYETMYSNTTGNFNTGFGYHALYSNTTGGYNLGMGYYSGRYIADGATANQTSTYCTFLGPNVRASANGVTYETAIGGGAIGSGSNSVTLGASTVTKTVINGSVGIGTTSPAASALLDMPSTTKGFLEPRMTTTQRDAIASPATGLSVYDNTINANSLYDGTRWTYGAKILPGSATLDFASTAAQTSSELTISVTGAADGDVVTVGVPNASASANTSYSARVSAANTVTVKFNNYSSGAVDPTSGTFNVKVFK